MSSAFFKMSRNIDMELFLQKVKENKVIYDLSCEGYRYPKIKDKVWDKIGKELNINGK